MNKDTVSDMALAVLRGMHGDNATAELLPTRYEQIHAALEGYWSDKIAHVWTVDDLIGESVENGYPITREHAVELLKAVWSDLGNDRNGVTWETIMVAIEDDKGFNLLDYTEPGKTGLVLGCFWVWLENDGEHYYDKFFGSDGDAISLRFEVEGNFGPALAYAKELATKNVGENIYLSSLETGGAPMSQLVIYTPINAPGEVMVEKDEQPDYFHGPDNDDEGIFTEKYENATRLGDDFEF